MEGVTSLISLPHPFFQQICLGMQQAHTAFYQWSASTALRLSRIFSGWFIFQKKLISNTFQYKNFFIIKNKSWILMLENLRSMKHLDEKWPQRTKVELIQTWKNLLWVGQFHPNFQDSSECYWKTIIASLNVVPLLCECHAHFLLAVPIIMNNPVVKSITEADISIESIQSTLIYAVLI